MTKETMASYANISIYSAMAVLAVAMILYAVYLAGMVPARVDARSGSPADDAATPQHARKMGGVAGTLTWLGGLLLLLAAVLRGASVNRAPLGNMHEFALVASMFTILLFCVWSLKRDLRWLGVFVVTPVLLVLGMAITAWYTEAAELLPSLGDPHVAATGERLVLNTQREEGARPLAEQAEALVAIAENTERTAQNTLRD